MWKLGPLLWWPQIYPQAAPLEVNFPALAVLLMVNVLPVIRVAELSRSTLAAPVMLSELPDTAPVDDSVAPATGNVVCNTSFTNLSDSRVKTEMVEADVAELKQCSTRGGQAAQAPGHERGPEAGTEMVTLDYSHLTSVLWRVCKGFQAGWTRWKPGRPSGGQRSHKKHGRRPQANHQGRLQGSPHRFWQHSADAAAGPGARPQHLQRGGEGVSGRPRVNQDRPQRGYNSFVPLEPMNHAAASGPGQHDPPATH